jgi:hypothetical protein
MSMSQNPTHICADKPGRETTIHRAECGSASFSLVHREVTVIVDLFTGITRHLSTGTLGMLSSKMTILRRRRRSEIRADSPAEDYARW